MNHLKDWCSRPFPAILLDICNMSRIITNFFVLLRERGRDMIFTYIFLGDTQTRYKRKSWILWSTLFALFSSIRFSYLKNCGRKRSAKILSQRSLCCQRFHIKMREWEFSHYQLSRKKKKSMYLQNNIRKNFQNTLVPLQKSSRLIYYHGFHGNDTNTVRSIVSSKENTFIAFQVLVLVSWYCIVLGSPTVITVWNCDSKWVSSGWLCFISHFSSWMFFTSIIFATNTFTTM